MSNNIFIVGGSKGGVGKSMITISLIDYLRQQEQKIVLIETDTSNPDVFKTYGELVTAHQINLEDANGWISLMNVADDPENKDAAIVINTRAANNDGVANYGENLNGALDELGRRLVVLWVINRQRDSLELLKAFRETMTNAVIHVIRNGYFGDESKYQLYNGSKLRQSIEEAGGLSETFPDMADMLADDIYSKRLTIEEAAKTLPIGNRAELKRWRSLAASVFDKVTK